MYIIKYKSKKYFQNKKIINKKIFFTLNNIT
jgi:hypothetical protein